MYTVFKMFNPKTGSDYIGYTGDLESRVNHLITVATTPGSRDENIPVHMTLRREGIENFELKVMAVVDNRKEALHTKVRMIKSRHPKLNVHYNR